MKPMPSSTPWFSRALAIALLLVPAAAHAQSLPKGYASDESPSSLPATVATTTTTSTTPELKSTTGEDTSTTATTEISTATDDYADTDPSALTDFQEPLQGYGSWVNDDSYGTVWVPDTSVVGSDFAPYQTGGYWSLADDDQWLWVSTYDWGYVPFHYGRWVWIGSRGWAWIPGRTYAPAWVVWRTSDYGYLGWAPMPPTWYWYGGSVAYFTTVPSAAYVFCPTSYVFHSNVSNYVVHDKDTVGRIASHSRPYKPANPTTVSTSNKAPDSASAGATHSASQISAAPKGNMSALHKPVGPSMKEAGVPDSVVPSKRTAMDNRAKLFSKKSTTAQAKTLVKTQRAAMASVAGARPVARAGSGLLQPGVVGRTSSGSTVGRAASAPSVRPSAPSVRPSAPITVGARASAPVYSAPRSSPVFTAPRVSAPAPRMSSPVFTAPRVSAPVSRPSFSVPRMSAPVSRPSFSAPRVSTPHFGGGGGVHFGGGHRR
ncbi:MAG: DUF6600 domain-containing protein [Polyangiaceae bacterium]